MSIIHETSLRDIINLITGSDDNKVKDPKFTSLTKSTNDLVLVFPVLCTTGISIETAAMITKAIEKNCVSLLQIYLASIQIQDTDSLQDYISKFHKNISFSNKPSVDDFVNLVSSFESANINDSKFNTAIMDYMKTINTEAKLGINEHSLSDFICYKTSNGYETVLESNNKNIPNTPNRKDTNLFEKMSSNEIKKANELMPTKVVVNFYSKSSQYQFDGGIIGVKAKLYPIDSMEIISRVSNKTMETNWLKEFIRSSTGEISFLRDFLFGIDKAKIDAVSSTKRGSSTKMWRVLERRANSNKVKRWKKSGRPDVAPITTLVISQDEVEYLKKEYDVNMEDKNTVMKLMDAYNFMGFVIVDEPAETASFIWDEGNNSEFETLSFRNLERESDDKNYRKVINLMTKISR